MTVVRPRGSPEFSGGIATYYLDGDGNCLETAVVRVKHSNVVCFVRCKYDLAACGRGSSELPGGTPQGFGQVPDTGFHGAQVDHVHGGYIEGRKDSLAVYDGGF